MIEISPGRTGIMTLSKIQLAALVLMARKGGACPGCDEATKALTFRTADKLVGMGLADYRLRAGVISYRLTSRGQEELAKALKG